MTQDLQRAADILRSKSCWCQRSKNVGHAVCVHCWAKLGEELRTALYMKGAAFIESYERALIELRKHVRQAKPVPSKRQGGLVDASSYPD